MKQFDPLKHGFEPITNFPELEYNFPMIDGYYVKVVTYADYGDLVYWYLIISEHIGLDPDDRIEISSGSYDFRRPSEYGKQNKCTTEYLGLITSDKFGELLLKHLLGTTRNESVSKEGFERYYEKVGPKMRKEYPLHYDT
jgi:hypothetical protein